MQTPYALLLFVVAVLIVLIGWGVYVQFSEPPPQPVTTQPTTPPLVERLREERERRIRERQGPPASTTSTAPAL